MTQQAKIAVTTSIILHIIGFAVLAGIKLYTETNVESEMAVTFVEVQKTKQLRRSALVRPMASLSKSPQNHSQEQAIIRPNHKSTVVFYTDAPEKVFSAVKGVERGGLEQTGIIYQPSGGGLQRMIDPIVTETKEPRLGGIKAEYRVSGGRDFLKEIKQAKAKPGLTDILGRFAEVVRRRIESKKRYPIAAQRSGVEGRAGVRMTILKNGKLEKVEIVESSGYEILDRAALRSVRRATPFPPIPEDAERDKVQLSIYLVFEIT